MTKTLDLGWVLIRPELEQLPLDYKSVHSYIIAVAQAELQNERHLMLLRHYWSEKLSVSL
jgi:hypothetical protein